MTEQRTSINLTKCVRDELRRYKAEDGLTYDEAIAQLLEDAEWITDKSALLEDE